MKIEKIDLYEYFGVKKPDQAEGVLTSYVLGVPPLKDDQRLRPAMLVLAGGAYAIKSDREKECIALKYATHSFNTYTLEYTCITSKYPTQLIEACMAIAYIREKAQEHRTNKDKVAAVGFSAGGHLCASLATLYGEPEVKAVLGDRKVRPDRVILSYPVITSGEYRHNGSIVNLVGEEDKALWEKVSLENRVNENSVPAFIWSTSEDTAVPCENSLYMALAYRKAGIPIELHIFEKGWHGLSTGTTEVGPDFDYIRPWFDLSIRYLKEHGFVLEEK